MKHEIQILSEQPPLQAPPEIQQLAETTRLGALKDVHRFIFKVRRIWPGAFVMLLCLFLSWLWGWSDGSSDPVFFVLLTVSAFFMIIVIASFLGLFLQRGNCVYVFEQGFVYKKQRGRSPVFRWEDIKDVFVNVKRDTRLRYFGETVEHVTHFYTIRHEDKYSARFDDDFERIEMLGETIRQQTLAIKLPQAIAAYDFGVPVVFGMYTVNKQGISSASKPERIRVSWNEIEDMQRDEKQLYIRVIRTDGEKDVKLMLMRDEHIFLALVDYARQQARYGAREITGNAEAESETSM